MQQSAAIGMLQQPGAREVKQTRFLTTAFWNQIQTEYLLIAGWILRNNDRWFVIYNKSFESNFPSTECVRRISNSWIYEQ